jgi:hypothetical protein
LVFIDYWNIYWSIDLQKGGIDLSIVKCQKINFCVSIVIDYGKIFNNEAIINFNGHNFKLILTVKYVYVPVPFRIPVLVLILVLFPVHVRVPIPVPIAGQKIVKALTVRYQCNPWKLNIGVMASNKADRWSTTGVYFRILRVHGFTYVSHWRIYNKPLVHLKRPLHYPPPPQAEGMVRLKMSPPAVWEDGLDMEGPQPAEGTGLGGALVYPRWWSPGGLRPLQWSTYLRPGVITLYGPE